MDHGTKFAVVQGHRIEVQELVHVTNPRRTSYRSSDTIALNYIV